MVEASSIDDATSLVTHRILIPTNNILVLLLHPNLTQNLALMLSGFNTL